jgi:succinoglycan biosynthesis transport protein ExoP
MSNLVAATGHRTLLIDADLRNPSLTRAMAPDASLGLVDVLTGRCLEQDAIWIDPVTALHVLPAATDGSLTNTAALISSAKMAAMLERLREHYEYIFVDLPPIAPVVDVRAAAHLLDGLLVVIEWGATSKDVIAEVVGEDEIIRGSAIGAVLNKANRATLRRLESYKGRYFSNYYREQA